MMVHEKKRSDIQGLRALAVILVVLYHLPTHANLDGGFVGVDIFFVISGFVVSRSIIERSKSGPEMGFVSGYRQYLQRRLSRLAPALSVFIIGTLVLSALFATTTSMRQIYEAGRSSIAYLSNFYYVQTFSSYWNPEILRSPFLHTWSLSVEFQIYLLLPFLMFPLITRKFSHRIVRKILIATIISGAVSLAVFSYLLLLQSSLIFGRSPVAIAFYSPITRIWEFALGISVALVYRGLKKEKTSRLRNFRLLGCSLIASCVVISNFVGSLNMSVVLGCLGTALLLAIGCENPTKHRLVFSSRPFVYVGDRSYSIYLWHWPLLALSSWLFPGSLSHAIVFLLPALILSIASHRFVERDGPPFFGRIQRQGKVAMLSYATLSGAAVAGALLLSSATWYLQPRPISEVSLPFYEIGRQVSEFTNATQGCEHLELEIHCKNVPGTDAEVVIMGDSLAYRAFPAFEIAARENGFNASMMWTGGCGIEFHSCPEFMYEYLKKSNVAGIFIAANFDRASNRLNTVERDAGVLPACPREKQTSACANHLEAVAKFQRAALKGIPELLTYSKRLVVALPFPQQSNSVQDCLIVPLYKRIFEKVSGDGACGKTSIGWQRERQGRFPDAIVDATETSSSVETWDPMDYLCRDGWCPAWINEGEQLMTDGVHWSLEGSRFLYPKFSETFDKWK
jgi:peptidoglycan/LPS O-acetylase OafA/YrhL